MLHIIVENENGDSMELTNNPAFDVLEVVGTNPPVAAINTVVVSGFDGSRFNSSRVEQRNIVITLNIQHPIERNRLTLYQFFSVKKWVRIRYKTATRDVFCDGYVESFENNPFTQLQQPQISIICPNPFWQADADTVVNFTGSTALFEFPFSIPSEGIPFSTVLIEGQQIVNVGEIETGAIITFSALGNVKNPQFNNLTTGEYFGVDVQLYNGDSVILDTIQGEKSVRKVSSGSSTNLLSARTAGSKWLQFQAGENLLSYSAEEGSANLRCVLTLRRKYEGV